MKLFPLEESPSFWIYRTHTQIVNYFRKSLQAAGYDLTPEQCGVLIRLRELEGINQAQLGERLCKDRHSMTRILSLLAERGYIERRSDKTDRRVWRIFVTKRGKALQDELVPMIEHQLKQLFEGIGADDVEKMQRTLKSIITRIERNT